MAESYLHRCMKESSSRKLESEGYLVFFEPPCAPSRSMTWVAYRPDVFGVRSCEGLQEYAFVECETRPSLRRLQSKNYRSVEVQSKLDSRLRLRRILVVPRGTLRRLDPWVRYSWETWIFGGGELFLTFPRAAGATSAPSA